MNDRLICLCAIAAASFAAVGCVVSIEPFYEEEALVFEEDLLGSWGNPDQEDSEPVTFGREFDNTYRVVFEEKGKKMEFYGHLFKIDDGLFLDLYPDLDTLEAEDLIKIHLLPLHGIARVKLDGDELSLRFMNGDWLAKQIEARKIRIDHRTHEDRLILTASTRKLQRFLKKHGDDADAYGDSEDQEVLKRVPAAE